jgi:hypothetical protein
MDDRTFTSDGASSYTLPDQEQFLAKVQRFILRTGMSKIPRWNTSCPFCSARLAQQDCLLPGEDEPDQKVAALEVCRRCTYWRWHQLDTYVYGSRGLMALHEYRSGVSKLAEFSVDLPAGCSEEMAVQIRRRPVLWQTMNPSRLEVLVADIIRANYEQIEVRHIGGTNDGGVDVLWIQSSNQRWLVQVKRRGGPSKGEGVGTIRNLLGAMILEGSKWGAVVSTADHFTYMAHRAVGIAAEVGMTIRLVDRHQLDGLLAPLLPVAPWMDFLEANFPDLVDRFAPKSAPSLDSQLGLFPDGELWARWSGR